MTDSGEQVTPDIEGDNDAHNDKTDDILADIYDKFYIEDDKGDNKPPDDNAAKDQEQAEPKNEEDASHSKEGRESPTEKSDGTQGASQNSPIDSVINNYKEYFNGERGNYTPEEAVNYLFAMQRSMDNDPLGTLLDIANTYGLADTLKSHYADQTALGDTQNQGGEDPVNILLDKINMLEQSIAGLTDKNQLDTHIVSKIEEQKQLNDAMNVVHEVSKDLPLFSDIPEDDLSYFINKSWGKLGKNAQMGDVLKTAYDMAVNADPDLRKKAISLNAPPTIKEDVSRVTAAKNATSVNIISNGDAKNASGLSPEEELAAIYDKLTK